MEYWSYLYKEGFSLDRPVNSFAFKYSVLTCWSNSSFDVWNPYDIAAKNHAEIASSLHRLFEIATWARQKLS